MKVPTVIQMQRADNAAATLGTMLGYYGRHVPMEELRPVCPSSRNGTSPELFCEAAEAYGLDATVRKLGLDELKRQELPVVVLWRRRAYTVVTGFRRGLVCVSDPAKGEYEITEEKFLSLYSGVAIELRPGARFEKGGSPTSLVELLSKRLGESRGELRSILFASVAAVLLNMAFVEGIRRLLEEDSFKGQPVYLLWIAVLAEALLLVGSTVFAMHKTWVVNAGGRRAAARSGSRLFKHLFRLPTAFFDQISAGELMQRVENNARLDRSLMLSTIPRVVDVAMGVVYLLLMFSYNLKVALVCLLVELVYVVAVRAQNNAIVLRSRSMTTSSGQLNASILNGIGTIDTIIASGTERVFFRGWHETQADFQDSSRMSLRQNAVTQLIDGAHSVFSSAALLFVGARCIMDGSFDVASMAAMQLVVGRVGTALGNCANTINSLQSMRTNIERVEDLNRRPTCPEVSLAEGAEHDKLRGAIELSHVCFRYNAGDPLAVDDVSFTVGPGQVFAIVGRTGCGKSTLLKLVSDLYTPQSGEILYGGKRRSEVADVDFRSSVVTVDQEIVMFEDTVSANLRMWDETIESYAMMMAAKDAQIYDRIREEPSGFETLVREDGKGFSGGELQRMELARALELEPTFLLLDEFTSALDALTEDRVMRAIRSLGATVIIVAHRLSTIRDADQIIVMDRGHIAARGTHDELMEVSALYRDLVMTE